MTKSLIKYIFELVLKLFVLVTTFLGYLILTTPVFATLFINEFSSETAGTIADPDWVEIYNSDSSPVDLSQYRLEDLNATNKKTLTGTIESSGFVTIDWSNKLNKTGDVISLIKISDSSQIDRVAYGDQGSDVVAPTAGQSAGRNSDGSGSWVIFSSTTKGSTNNTATPVPSPEPSLSPSPTPTSSAQTSNPKSPSPTPKASPTQISAKSNPSPTPGEESVLGKKESTPSLTISSPLPSPSPSPQISPSRTKIAAILTGSGAMLIGLSFGFFLWYKRLLENAQNSKTEDKFGQS